MAGPFPSVPIYFVTNSGIAFADLNFLNIVGSGGTSITGSGNTITVGVSGSGMTWSALIASQTLAVNNGYFCESPGGVLILPLPAVSNIGDEIEIYLDGATSFEITQAANQSIKFGAQVTTTGIGGSLISTGQGDGIRMVCMTSNLRWNIVSCMGNLTFV